ncbi:Mrr restriction system protein [Lysobacter sp. 5GHs7-4]|uniref:restriction endonuclease n=1 Tax=Lysobacter sp. 5GHs7-4 TaxID=2904253 RepID=UPI001E487DF4|nr:restriction endonuclease [Lysobacter sp. 5GHs7-4]UHQ24590.1 Mrr restriction system protein [Lysobacter sp. 5GHs7-4]
MADITKARTGLLIRKLFEILLSQREGMRAADALGTLEKAVQLTAYEAGDYDSGGRRFERIVRFATVSCVKAGWLIKHKGVWTVSDEGQAAYAQFGEPEKFYREAERLYWKWRKAQPATSDAAETEEAVEKSAVITLEQAEEMAWKEIEAFLAEMPPYEFQELVGELLRAMDYHVAWIAPAGKDGGIDVIAYNDPLGTRPPRIKVQVKRNANSPRIDVVGLRSFMAVLGDGDVGLFVAMSGFTRDAEAEARQSQRRVTLLDTTKLVDLWTEHYAKLDDAARRRLPLKPVWFLAGED